MMGIDAEQAQDQFGFLWDAFTFGGPPQGANDSAPLLRGFPGQLVRTAGVVRAFGWRCGMGHPCPETAGKRWNQEACSTMASPTGSQQCSAT